MLTIYQNFIKQVHLKSFKKCKTTDASVLAPTSKQTEAQTFSSDFWQSPVVKKYLDAYEDVVGLTEVKHAQSKVLEVCYFLVIAAIGFKCDKPRNCVVVVVVSS